MRDDDFELTFDTDEQAPEAFEDFVPPRANRLFDWQREDPEDFGEPSPPETGGTTFHTEPPQPGTGAEPTHVWDGSQHFAYDIALDDAATRRFAYDVPLGDGPARPFAYDVPLGPDAAVPAPQPAEPDFAPPQPEPDPAPAPAPAQPERAPDSAGYPARPTAPAQPEPAGAAFVPARPGPDGGRVRCGRTVLISGGDRGIGAAAARAFWQAGYNTAILYHTKEAAARALVNELGCDCAAVHCDVASYEECAAAFKVVERAFGSVDVLVCNAGIAQQKLFTDLTPAEWQCMLDVNLTGAFNLCQAALPGMIRRKWGRILTVSSMWGQTGGSCEVHYSAAKAGLIGLTKALAKEEGPSGITVNCVAPGVIETDMMAAFSAEDKAALAQDTPVGRLGQPGEVASLLVYLAGEGAGFITGQVFGVNGGLVI